MKWEGNRQSDNVEDRRGQGGGGFGGMLGGRSIGIGTIVLALVGSMIFGVNPLTIINVLSGMGGSAPVTQSAPAPAPPKEDPVAAFVSTVLAETEDVWTELFRQSGASYVKPKLVLYSGRTATACAPGTNTRTSKRPSRISACAASRQNPPRHDSGEGKNGVTKR